MMILTIIGFVMGVVGGISGVFSVLYTRKQAKVMQEELGRLLRQDHRAEEWAKKYDEAASLLTRIFSGKFPTGPSIMTGAYTYIFRSDELRGRIERYLGHRSFWGAFQPTLPTGDQLQNPVVQETIQEVLDLVETFKADHTDFARALG